VVKDLFMQQTVNLPRRQNIVPVPVIDLNKYKKNPSSSSNNSNNSNNNNNNNNNNNHFQPKQEIPSPSMNEDSIARMDGLNASGNFSGSPASPGSPM
jgi:hypothetical protein